MYFSPRKVFQACENRLSYFTTCDLTQGWPVLTDFAPQADASRPKTGIEMSYLLGWPKLSNEERGYGKGITCIIQADISVSDFRENAEVPRHL